MHEIEKEFEEYQGGFRPRISYAEQIFNLKSIFSNTRSTKRDLVAIFVDFRKFDSIHRDSLFKILYKLKVET